MIARLSPYPLKRLRTSIVGQRRQISSCPSLPQLHGKIAVVTGANDGIGKETARGLLGDLAQNHGVKIAGKRLLMLGAGGATRGVLAAIADLPAAERPATITVANRTLEKAEALATDFAGKLSVTASSYAQAGETCYDILINGTSAGFGGELTPLSPAALGEGCCCYDMMYSSQQTAFQAWALSHGAALAPDGLGMLVGQAAEAFFVWRGVRDDVEQAD